MIDSPFFDLPELVCEHVYEKYGNFAWNFLDVRAIVTLNTIRDRIGKPIFVNNWLEHGNFDERGLRCMKCSIAIECIADGILHMSAHFLGKGFDFEVQGLLAGEVREWIKLHANWWPYPIRLEKNVSWVHLDLMNDKDGIKVYEFEK